MDEELRTLEQSILLLQTKYDRRLLALKDDFKSDLQAFASRIKVTREGLNKK